MVTMERTILSTTLLLLCLHPNKARACAAQMNGGQTSSSPASATAATTSTPSVDSAPLSSPAMMGPLSARPPIVFNAGPFGKLAANGVLSGFGVWQNNPAASDNGAGTDISNGQVFLQKTTGIVQFYLQAGAYNLPSLGTAFLTTTNTIDDYYGPLPVAYLKLAPTGSFSLLAGKLPSLIGAEYTFTFENMNIERGLLWNQENSVTHAVQLNYTHRKLAGSLVWGDGFYSGRWNWLTGALTYTLSSANSLELVAGGNLGNTSYSSVATPAPQNNSSIYNLMYTHTAKNWTIAPYFQFTHLSEHPQIGVFRTSSTQGEAVLASYNLRRHIALAGRLEYISSTGNAAQGAANLLYGPGSNAFSVTATPTYQDGAFFARGEFSLVRGGTITPGDAFGPEGTNSSQIRGLVEAGFLF